jgi:ribose transport system ATP-binding protein
MKTGVEQPALEVTGVRKDFNGQLALAGVDFRLRRGEVHALLGANGSGKSTLIKILMGFHQPDEYSTATVAGRALALGSATDAVHAGMRVIHQDLGLVDEISVLDNLCLGGQYAHRYWISDRRERTAAHSLLSTYGVDLDPLRALGSLSATEKTMIAIVRALRDDAVLDGVLILDEPTASLPERESEQLFGLIENVASRGGSVIYVTHRLDEVFRLADRVTVLRDGQVATTRETSTFDHESLIEQIVGRPVQKMFPETESKQRQAIALSVDGLTGEAVRDLSALVHDGEIVGITGLAGSGADEALALIFGAFKPAAGRVEVGGRVMQVHAPYESIEAGLVFAPPDRPRLSTIPSWSLAENLTLPRLGRAGSAWWLSAARENLDSLPWLRELEVSPAEPLAIMSTLSGGNQQKAVLARWLRCRPRVFMLQEPTAGVDVGARSRIYSAITTAAADGAGVLIASTDVDEICGLCSRVLVMARGRVVAELVGEQITSALVTTEMLKGRVEMDVVSLGATRTNPVLTGNASTAKDSA